MVYRVALLVDRRVTLEAMIAEIRQQQDWQSVLLQACIVGVKIEPLEHRYIKNIVPRLQAC